VKIPHIPFLYYIFYLLVFVSASKVFASPSNDIGLTDQERAFLVENQLFNVHMEQGFPPFSYIENNNFIGFSVEFSELIAAKLGIAFHYNRDETWEQALANIKTGKTDIIAQMIHMPEREEFANFTSGYMKYFQSIVVLKANTKTLNTVDSLLNKRVGVGAGYAVEAVIKQHYPEIKLITFKDSQQLVEAVISGKIDAAITSHQFVQHDILSRFITDIVSLPILDNTLFSPITESFAIRKGYPLLHSAMQKAIDSLHKEHLQLQIEWFSELEPYHVALSEKEHAFLNQHGSIKYCIDPGWKPFEFRDEKGQHQGLSADLIALFSERSHIHFQYVPTTSWAESLAFLKARKCDFLPLAVQTNQRKSYMALTSNYMNFPLVIATQNDQSFISDFKDIADKPIAIVTGYSIIETLREKYKNTNIIEVANGVEGLDLVEAGDAFAYIDTIGTIRHLVQENNLLGIKISGKLDQRWDVSIGVRNDSPELLSIMEKNINNITDDEKQAIHNKWISVRVEESMDYSLFWKGLVAVLIIGLFVSYRYRELRRMNTKIQATNDELAAAKKELELIITQDYLTGLFNRKRLDEVIKNETYRSQRFGSALGLLMLDIDHFKKVNDNFGHDVGDKVIIEVAQLIQNNVRLSDTAGRWGGEEFMVICPETNKDDLQQLAEKLRIKIATTPIPPLETIAVSIGITIYNNEEQIAAFQKRADQALYIAKDNGRNRTQFL